MRIPFLKVGALKVDERTYARYMSDVAYFLSKLEAEPDSYYFIPIALAYNKLEKYDETISVCRAGLERFPNHCQAKVLLAEAYVYKGETDRARDILFDVLTDDEDNYKALKLLGIIYQALEMPDEAIKYFRGAYLRSPEDTELKRTVEDMGGSVDIDDVIKSSASSGEAAGEDDEDSRTFFEIEQKIKNAELVMADLVADKSIMGPKRGDEDSGPALAMAGDSNLISDDELERLISMANSPEAAPTKREEITPPGGSAMDDGLAGLTGPDETAGEDSADSEHAPEYGEQAVSADSAPVLEEPGALYVDDGLQPAPGEPEGGEDGLLAALNAGGGSDDSDGLISALTGNVEDNSAEDDLISALGGEAESDGDDLLAALSDQDGLAEHIEEPEPLDAPSDNTDASGGGSEAYNKNVGISDGDLSAANNPAPADPAPALVDSPPAADGPVSGGDSPADLMIPDDDFDFDDDDGYAIPQYADPSAPENEAAVGPEGASEPVDLGDSAPFVQSDIWDEILEASAMEDDGDITGPGEEKEKAARERQLKKLEERLEKLRKRTEK